MKIVCFNRMKTDDGRDAICGAVQMTGFKALHDEPGINARTFNRYSSKHGIDCLEQSADFLKPVIT